MTEESSEGKWDHNDRADDIVYGIQRPGVPTITARAIHNRKDELLDSNRPVSEPELMTSHGIALISMVQSEYRDNG